MHNQYLQDRSISRDWKEREFVSQIKDYFDRPIKKVLLIEYYFDTDNKTYIVNSSLTWQLLRTLFQNIEMRNSSIIRRFISSVTFA